jgi:hypothetical protein
MLRLGRKIMLAEVVALLLGFPALRAQEVSDALKRPVSVPEEYSPLSDHLLMLFKSAGVSGGIAIVNEQCGDASGRFPQFKGSLQGALESLVSGGYHVQWRETEGILFVGNTPLPPQLLETYVNEFRFSRKDSLVKASSTLLDEPEAREALRSLRLTEYGPELGFAQPRQPDGPGDSVYLTNATVLSALNKIGGGHSVWLYKESKCERNIVSLNWPVR